MPFHVHPRRSRGPAVSTPAQTASTDNNPTLAAQRRKLPVPAIVRTGPNPLPRGVSEAQRRCDQQVRRSPAELHLDQLVRPCRQYAFDDGGLALPVFPGRDHQRAQTVARLPAELLFLRYSRTISDWRRSGCWSARCSISARNVTCSVCLRRRAINHWIGISRGVSSTLNQLSRKAGS